jgi:hypothetical protein
LRQGERRSKPGPDSKKPNEPPPMNGIECWKMHQLKELIAVDYVF